MVDAVLPTKATDVNPYTFGTSEWMGFNDQISVLNNQGATAQQVNPTPIASPTPIATPTDASVAPSATPSSVTAPATPPVMWGSIEQLQTTLGRPYQPTDRVMGIAPGSTTILVSRDNDGNPTDFSFQWSLLDRGIQPILDYGGAITSGPRVPNGVVLSAADAASLAGGSEGFRGTYGGSSGAAAQNYNTMVADVNTQLAAAPSADLTTKALQDATVRPGYTDIDTIGDQTDIAMTKTLEQQNVILQAMGMPTVTVQAVLGTQLENQRASATTLNSQQFFNNELQKLTENNIENMAAYHADAMASGVQQAANPFAYQADLSLALLKGGNSKDFGPTSLGAVDPDTTKLISLLPDQLGLQETAWNAGKTQTMSTGSFASAVSVVNAASGLYGPYAALYGGKADTRSAFEGISIPTNQKAVSPESLGIDSITPVNPTIKSAVSPESLDIGSITPVTSSPSKGSSNPFVVDAVELTPIVDPDKMFVSAPTTAKTEYVVRTDPLAVIMEGFLWAGDTLTFGMWKPGSDLLTAKGQNANPTLDTFNTNLASVQSEKPKYDALASQIQLDQSSLNAMTAGKLNAEGKFTGTADEYAKYTDLYTKVSTETTQYNQYNDKYQSTIKSGIDSGAIVSSGNGYTVNPDNVKEYGAFSDWSNSLSQTLRGGTTQSQIVAYENSPDFKTAGPVTWFGEGSWKALTNPVGLAGNALQGVELYTGMGLLGAGVSALAPEAATVATGTLTTTEQIGLAGQKILTSPVVQYGTGALFVGAGVYSATEGFTAPAERAVSNLGGATIQGAATIGGALAPEGMIRIGSIADTQLSIPMDNEMGVLAPGNRKVFMPGWEDQVKVVDLTAKSPSILGNREITIDAKGNPIVSLVGQEPISVPTVRDIRASMIEPSASQLDLQSFNNPLPQFKSLAAMGWEEPVGGGIFGNIPERTYPATALSSDKTIFNPELSSGFTNIGTKTFTTENFVASPVDSAPIPLDMMPGTDIRAGRSGEALPMSPQEAAFGLKLNIEPTFVKPAGLGKITGASQQMVNPEIVSGTRSGATITSVDTLMENQMKYSAFEKSVKQQQIENVIPRLSQPAEQMPVGNLEEILRSIQESEKRPATAASTWKPVEARDMGLGEFGPINDVRDIYDVKSDVGIVLKPITIDSLRVSPVAVQTSGTIRAPASIVSPASAQDNIGKTMTGFGNTPAVATTSINDYTTIQSTDMTNLQDQLQKQDTLVIPYIDTIPQQTPTDITPVIPFTPTPPVIPKIPDQIPQIPDIVKPIQPTDIVPPDKPVPNNPYNPAPPNVPPPTPTIPAIPGLPGFGGGGGGGGGYRKPSYKQVETFYLGPRRGSVKPAKMVKAPKIKRRK